MRRRQRPLHSLSPEPFLREGEFGSSGEFSFATRPAPGSFGSPSDPTADAFCPRGTGGRRPYSEGPWSVVAEGHTAKDLGPSWRAGTRPRCRLPVATGHRPHTPHPRAHEIHQRGGTPHPRPPAIRNDRALRYRSVWPATARPVDANASLAVRALPLVGTRPHCRLPVATGHIRHASARIAADTTAGQTDRQREQSGAYGPASSRGARPDNRDCARSRRWNNRVCWRV